MILTSAILWSKLTDTVQLTLSSCLLYPRQTNSCDCGMFVLMYAKSRAEISDWDDDWGFTETDMGDLRVGMLKEFLAKKLL